MTTFKAKNVFLVFGMGHTMNKLTNEYKKMQNFKNLVDLQCKCVKLDTPRIGPILGFPPSKKSKSTLNFLSIWKSLHASLEKYIFELRMRGFWDWKIFRGTFWFLSRCLFLGTKPDFHLPTSISNTLKLLNPKCLTYLERVFTILYGGSTLKTFWSSFCYVRAYFVGLTWI